MKLFLLLLLFCLRADGLFCERLHGGFCCEDGSCICNPPYSGPRCAEIDYCQSKDCSERGVCDVNTGACECEDKYTGPNCEWMDCGKDGVFNPSTHACTCISGYTGPGCKICLIRPEGHNNKNRYICCPAEWDKSGNTFLLMSVTEADMYHYVTGIMGFPYCMFPNTTMRNGRFLDCACRMHIPPKTAPSHHGNNNTEPEEPTIVPVTTKPQPMVENLSQRISNVQAFFSAEMVRTASYVAAYNNPTLLTQLVEQLQSLKSYSIQSSSVTLPNSNAILLFVIVTFIALGLLVCIVFVFASLARTPSETRLHSSMLGVSSSGVNPHFNISNQMPPKRVVGKKL